ncbi:MAG: hypothetical protein CMH54_03070 [Myxococcales bacterium]|nr:hypothetical protein [Myxococcales bacterium]
MDRSVALFDASCQPAIPVGGFSTWPDWFSLYDRMVPACRECDADGPENMHEVLVRAMTTSE